MSVSIRRMITTRRGGVSTGPYAEFNLGAGVGDDPVAVAANRARLARAAGLAATDVAWMRQVHGTTVARVDRGTAATPVADTDGLVTATPGLGLAVLVADCVTVLAGDRAHGVAAAVHAGRRGAAGGVVVRALDEMRSLGADLETIEVLLGPAICGACYEVPAAMRDEVEATLPGSASVTRQGTPGLDLRAGLARQLRDAGVRTVTVDPRCTREDDELYSHRRGAPTGRFAGLIWVEA